WTQRATPPRCASSLDARRGEREHVMIGRRRVCDARRLRAIAAATLGVLGVLVACTDDRGRSGGTAPAPVPTAKAAGTAEPAGAAGVVIRQARIFTGDPGRPWALALAVKDGRIVAVGSNAEIKPWIGGGTRVIELRLDFVMAGMVEPPGVAAPAASGEVELS